MLIGDEAKMKVEIISLLGVGTVPYVNTRRNAEAEEEEPTLHAVSLTIYTSSGPVKPSLLTTRACNSYTTMAIRISAYPKVQTRWSDRQRGVHVSGGVLDSAQPLIITVVGLFKPSSMKESIRSVIDFVRSFRYDFSQRRSDFLYG